MTKEKIMFGAGLVSLALVAAVILVISSISPSQIGQLNGGIIIRPPEGQVPAPQQVAAPKTEGAKFENMLSVSGTGVARANPDRVLVSLSISQESKTAQQATETAAGVFNKLVQSMTAEGIVRSDIQSNSINLSPVYFYPRDQPPQITGYRLVHSITVTVKSQDATQLGSRAGRIIDAVISSGVTGINGITFTVGDETIKALRTQALKTAIEDAKDKATTMSAALGVKILGVSSISESVYVPTPSPVFKGAREVAAVQAAPPTEIVPGEFEVSVNVYVSYGISG
jgi:uncharacterized protein YggE